MEEDDYTEERKFLTSKIIADITSVTSELASLNQNMDRIQKQSSEIDAFCRNWLQFSHSLPKPSAHRGEKEKHLLNAQVDVDMEEAK